MVRKYGVYLKEGMKSAKITMKRKGSKINFYLFMLMKFVSMILFMFFPMFQVAETRLSKQSIKVNDLDVIGSFKNGAKPKVFWNTTMANIIGIGIALGGVIGIGALTGLLILIAYSLSGLSDVINQNALLLYFSIPGMIVAVVYLVIVMFYFAPFGYISDTIENIDPSTIISKSYASMRKGKFIVFLNKFIPTFVFIVLNALFIAGYVVLESVVRSPFITLIYAIVVSLVCLVIIFFAPRFLLGFINANTLFYEDCVLDEITGKRVVKGVILSKKTSSNNLLNLFNKTEEHHFTKNNKLSSKAPKEEIEEVEEFEEEPTEENVVEEASEQVETTEEVTKDNEGVN